MIVANTVDEETKNAMAKSSITAKNPTSMGDLPQLFIHYYTTLKYLIVI